MEKSVEDVVTLGPTAQATLLPSKPFTILTYYATGNTSFVIANGIK